MSPYSPYVDLFASAAALGRRLPLGGFPPSRPMPPAADAPKALIFSPHPDDECIIGALPRRLQMESGWRIINVAVTQGSARARQAGRAEELRGACGYLGFEIRWFPPGGMERVTLAARTSEPSEWSAKVDQVVALLRTEDPSVVFVPHERDWNGTHIGVHWLVRDALARWTPSRELVVVETEYWGAMDRPNLMVEVSRTVLSDLVAGASFHEGEMRRNPFHLLLPAWMQDNVRRGSELVGGQGMAAPQFDFATLYRVTAWRSGGFQPVWEGGRQLGAGQNAARALA